MKLYVCWGTFPVPWPRRGGSWRPSAHPCKHAHDALRAAGVPTSYYDGLGLIHGYFGLGEASETAKREAQRARADFKALLEKGA